MVLKIQVREKTNVNKKKQKEKLYQLTLTFKKDLIKIYLVETSSKKRYRWKETEKKYITKCIKYMNLPKLL